jgi:hypothetical protein
LGGATSVWADLYKTQFHSSLLTTNQNNTKMPPIVSEIVKITVKPGFSLDAPEFAQLRKVVVEAGVKEQYYGTCTDTPNTLLWVIRALIPGCIIRSALIFICRVACHQRALGDTRVPESREGVGRERGDNISLPPLRPRQSAARRADRACVPAGAHISVISNTTPLIAVSSASST